MRLNYRVEMNKTDERIGWYDLEDGEFILIRQYQNDDDITDEILMTRDAAINLCREILECLET